MAAPKPDKGDVKTSKVDQNKGISGTEEPFHKRMSDVSLYSFSGLCAFSLAQLFADDWHREFKKETLQKILKYLDQPDQTHDSIFAMMKEEDFDNSPAFVDIILQEECLAETREPLIAEVISIHISQGCYDARVRVLIKHIAWLLRVTWDQVEEIEEELAELLEHNAYVMSEDEAKEKQKKQRNRKVKRYALIGLATIGGGALIGLTGGLAAPLVAAGAGAIIGGAGAAALGSAAGVAIIGSLFGVAGAGLTGYKMKRRVGAIEEFAFEALTLIGSGLQSGNSVKQLHITIAVTGWLTDKIQDFRLPWSCLAESKEQYSLRWESKYLKQLGEAFEYILQAGISMATTEALKYTILSGIITAIAWPAALISVAGAIDNPWHVCTQRATEAGKQLAEVLLAREQGKRPVTLIGFSLGARVIFSCLEELAKRKGSEGLIEDVILLGTPVSGDPKHWRPIIKVVAGKIVNGYSRGDWLLKFLYRTASVQYRVAGLGPVKLTDRRFHNIDLSDVIEGHSDYLKNLDTIMKAVGVRTKDELKPAIPRSKTYTGSTSSDGPTTNSINNNTGIIRCSASVEFTDDKYAGSSSERSTCSSEDAGNSKLEHTPRDTASSLAESDNECDSGSSDYMTPSSSNTVICSAQRDKTDIPVHVCKSKENRQGTSQLDSDEQSSPPFHRALCVEEEIAQRLLKEPQCLDKGKEVMNTAEENVDKDKQTKCYSHQIPVKVYEECEFTDSDPDVSESD